jgi:DNA-binding transcriptional LysR family regulator
MPADEMRIRDLKFVVALYEAGNMTLAAKRLGISESALSQRLRKIEHRAQERFFDRENGGVKVTDSGRLFVAHAKDTIHAFQEAVHSAREARHGELHKLRVGVSAFLPDRWLHLVQSIILPLFRNLTIEIVTAYSMELLAMVESHQLDLALMTSPPESALIVTRCAATNSFMIVLRESHPLAARKTLALADVTPHPWIFF